MQIIVFAARNQIFKILFNQAMTFLWLCIVKIYLFDVKVLLDSRELFKSIDSR